MIWLAGVVAATVLLSLPTFHYIRWIGDEGIWLRAGMEMLRGKVLYRDFFEFQGPTGFFIVAGWLSAFGQSIFALRSLTTALAALNAALIFLVCRRASGSAALAAVLAILWVLASQGGNVELTHHSMTSAFSLGALWACLAGRPLLAGVLSAGAATVTQTRGALCIAAAFTSIPRGRAPLLRFIAGLAVLPAIFGIYLLAEQALGAAWRNVVLWPLTSYADIQGLPFGKYADGATWWAVALYPASLLLGAFVWWRNRDDRELWACIVFAAAGLAGSFPRPDAIHLVWTVPQALPLAARLGSDLLSRLPRRWLIATASLVALLALVSITSFAARLLVPAPLPPTIATPAGDISFGEREVPELVARVTSLPEDARVFFYPYMPVVSFVTRREQVGRYDIFLPHYTTKAQYEDAARDVAEHADWIVYDKLVMSPRHMKAIYPKMPDARPLELDAMEALLADKFVTVWSNARFEIRRRR